MMENYSLDPYEHQLFKVFEGHDIDNKGSLDKDGLIKLCETLQLEDKTIELTKVLLEDRKSIRVTFSEFKDALLNLLGTMQNRDTLDLNTSPEREVSPKFVYGSKKYGRRSRPRCEEIISNKEIGEGEYNNKIASATVQRSNSQNEVSYSKKRKTNVKLKRCTSFPSVNDQKPDVVFHSNVNSEVVCTENMLRQAWKKLGVGEDGFLNQTELIVVCDAIGLNKLADSVIRQLSNKLVMDYNKRISFQELLEALQQDETWSEFLTSTPPPPQNPDFEVNLSLNSSTSYHDSKSLPHIKLGPDGTGLINTESVLELWEQAGISAPKVLLADLGFKGRNINVHELTLVLDKEIRGLNEFRIDHTCNPHAALLHAFLTLHQTEIRCLRNILEQMQEEREKLKCDVFEANNRATLLAQEVDDNVANMELNTQKHVKLLEQRHMELLKEATEQFTLEKEQMSFLNQELENKLKNLENEEVKVRDELLGTQKYCTLIEKENQDLTYKINELEEIKNTLQKQIDVLEMEKIKSKDLELEQREKLIAKISELQFENTNLRDKHDEMVSKIEALSNENASLKNKNAIDGSEDVTDISVICEGVHLGTKRRNEKSSQDLNALEILGNESPRLEKVRKFGINYLRCEQPFMLNDSGYDTEQDNPNTCGHSLQSEEFARLQKRIQSLEQLLKENSIKVPDSGTEDESEEKTNKLYKLRTCKYRNVLIDIKTMVNKMENNNEYQNLSKYLGKIIADTRVDDANSLLDEIHSCKEQLLKVEGEKQVLTGKCEDLENGLSLLRNEYEKCEDYWQNKLDDERRLFEQEQNHNTEKLNELLAKLGEFEDQYLKDNNRLPTIIEADNLEKQFTDLEFEYKEYKDYMQAEVEGKDAEIFELREKLQDLHAYCFKEKCDVSVQFDDENMGKEKHLNLTNHVIESTNFYSADAMPFNWNQTILQNITIDQTAIENTPHSWSKEESSIDATSISSQLQGTKEKSFSLFTLPSTSHTNVWEHKTMPFRQKRTRNHDKVLSQHRLPKKNNEKFKNIDTEIISDYGYAEVAGDKNNEQKCLIPVSMLHNLHAKKHHLEQRCKKLQWILKQQHQYDEQLLHCSWQQHRNERSELQYYIKYYHDKLEQQLQIANEQQERLAKNDSLVKDLFVDNSYLLAKNQRLEQQYQMLANNLNTSSV